MSMTPHRYEPPFARAGADDDALIERLRALPEPEALRCYTQLTPRLQWIVRQRMTGSRRTALIVHHAVSIAHCK
jgi:hypothetical protein